MTFSEAVAALESGEWVRRDSWERPYFISRRGSMRDEFEGLYDDSHDTYQFLLDCIPDVGPGYGLSGSVSPWSPDADDEKATDWVTVEQPQWLKNKTPDQKGLMNGNEAERLALSGTWVRRACWPIISSITVVARGDTFRPLREDEENYHDGLYLIGLDRFSLDNDEGEPGESAVDCVSGFTFTDEQRAATDWQLFQVIREDTTDIEKQRQAAIDEMVAGGWKWSATEKNVLVSPTNPEHNVWVNPYTKEQFLSSALTDELRKRLGKGSA